MLFDADSAAATGLPFEPLTRRQLALATACIFGAAAVPNLILPEDARAAEVDPIFAALERYKAALAAYNAEARRLFDDTGDDIDEVTSPFKREWDAAEIALFERPPISLEGLAALVNHATLKPHDLDHLSVLDAVAASLDILTAASTA